MTKIAPEVRDDTGAEIEGRKERKRKFGRASAEAPTLHRTTFVDPPKTRREIRALAAEAPALAGPQVKKPAPVTTTDGTVRNWRFPALDGLRGLAVVSVMLYHTNWNSRGLFGVDVFFVISGFLITLLLLRELSDTGRVRIGTFFVRRVKRLIPALLITLAAVLAVAWWTSDIRELTEISGRSWWALWQAANWSQIADGTAYWDANGQIRPLAQMWSLSITEQFYLVWPFVIAAAWFLCRRSVTAVGIVLVLLTAAAAAVAPLLWDGENSDRLYLGTDARAVAFIAGAAAAGVVMQVKKRRDDSSSPGRLTRISVTTLSVVALSVVVVASVLVTSYHDAWLYEGGLAIVAVAAAVFVGTLCFAGNVLVRFFSFSVFRGIGVVSYSVFLLHLPVFWVLQKLTPTIAPLTLFIVGGTITWLLSAFLHHGITERIRRAPWTVWPALPVFLVSIGIVAAASHYLPILRVQQAAVINVAATDAGTPGEAMPAGIEGGRPLVLTVGDSLANDFASTLMDHGTGAVAVVDAGQGGCGLLDATAVRATSGYLWDTVVCPDWRETWPAAMAEQPTDFILVHLGWDATDQLIDDEWLNAGDAEFQDLYAQALDEFVEMAQAEAPDAEIAFVLGRPTDGIVTDPTATAALSRLIVEASERHDAVSVIDLGAALCGTGPCRTTDDAGRDLFLIDNVHLSPVGRDYIAVWLEESVRDILLDR